MASKEKPINKKDIQELLSNQTTVILNAVDEKLSVGLIRLEMRIDKKLEAMEERWNRKFDKLIVTLDKFLQKMTSMEDEFATMKNDLSRVKRVIKEKLGVEL